MTITDEHTLNFYGLVSMHVRAPKKAATFLETEWGKFLQSDGGRDPDVTVTWDGGLPKRTPPSLGGQAKKLGGWYKGCFWHAFVSEGDGGIAVDYSCLPPSGFLFKDACLEPLLLAALESKGIHSIHASSVAIGGQAWGFCGPTGSGKTILALLLAKSGHMLLSDDVTLTGNGVVYPYCVPPRLYLRDYVDRDLFREISYRRVPTNFVRNLMIDIVTLGQVRIPSRLLFADHENPYPPRIGGYPLKGLFFVGNGGSRSGVFPWHDKNEILREIVQNSPIHGGAMTGALEIGRTMDAARERGLRSEVGGLVDSGRCFRISGQPGMRVEEWKHLVNEATVVARELD